MSDPLAYGAGLEASLIIAGIIAVIGLAAYYVYEVRGRG